MRRALLAATVTLLACGSHDAPRPSPAAPPLPPVAIAPTAATPVAPPAPPPPIHVTATVLSPGAPWVAPPIVIPPPPAAAVALVRDPWTVAPIPGGRASLPRLPVVTHGSQRLHFPQLASTAVSDRLAQLVPADAGFTRFGRGVTARCDVTLARPNLASFLCTGYGDQDDEAVATGVGLTYRVDGDALHVVPIEDAFVPGTRLDRVIARACDWFPERSDVHSDGEAATAPSPSPERPSPAAVLAPPDTVAAVVDVDDTTLTSSGRCGAQLGWAASLGPDGLHATMTNDNQLTEVVVPWGDLGAVARRDGPLLAIPGALDATPDAHAAIIAHAATPDDPGAYCALTGPLSWTDLARVAEGIASPESQRLRAVPAGAGRAELALDGECDRGFGVGALAARLHLAPVERARDRPLLRVLPTTTELSTAAPLRATPGGAVVETLPLWTYGYAIFGGRVDGVDSHAIGVPPPPQIAQTFFVTARDGLGWTPSVGIEGNGSGLIDTRGGLEARTAFATTLPVELRDALMAHTTVSISRGETTHWIFVAQSASTQASFVASYGRDAHDLLSLRLDGAFRSATVLAPQHREPRLFVVATRVAADPPGIERWVAFADGQASPVLAQPLASGADARPADAVHVEVASDVPSWAPLRVTQSGQPPIDYTWNGTALVRP